MSPFNVKSPSRRIPLSLAISAALASPLSMAQQAVEGIVVFGRNTDLVGRAVASSEGSISGADLLVRPMFKTAELLESMPGMVAVQHSGSGKANQYFLRGFNLDHGTDYTVILDGMPMNIRSHGHGQGYLDVNGLIPETVDGIDYRKGPYRADIGDFSVAGASFIRTIDTLEQSFVSTEAGENYWRRFVGGTSLDASGGRLTMIGEYKLYDGPWQSSEELDHLSVWSKYRRNTGFGQAVFTLSGYEAEWNPTEQIPERSIGSAVCLDAFCSPDPTAEGSTSRWIVTGQWFGSDWSASAYAQYYNWALSSNPTYDFQLNQFDKRWTMGGSVSKSLVDSDGITVNIGGDARYDDGSGIGLDNTVNGLFVANISDNEIKEGSIGSFIEATWRLSPDLRAMGGVRGDYYDFDVIAHTPGSHAGAETDSQASPKLGLAYTLTDALELYGNWGRGFHSNDARGVVNSADPVPGLSQGTGHEIGARTSVGDFKFTATWWWLEQDSELIFIGDSNAVEPKGGSERDGIELTAFWQPLNWLGLDAVYTESDARYTNNPDGDYVESALEKAAQFGISASRNNWDFSLRMRYMGPYALAADNLERASSLTTVSVRGARHWDTLTVYAEVINLLYTDGKEINYTYEAYIDGYDPAGLNSEDIDCSVTNCRMSRSTVPRTFRAGVSYKF